MGISKSNFLDGILKVHFITQKIKPNGSKEQKKERDFSLDDLHCTKHFDSDKEPELPSEDNLRKVFHDFSQKLFGDFDNALKSFFEDAMPKLLETYNHLVNFGQETQVHPNINEFSSKRPYNEEPKVHENLITDDLGNFTSCSLELADPADKTENRDLAKIIKASVNEDDPQQLDITVLY